MVIVDESLTQPKEIQLQLEAEKADHVDDGKFADRSDLEQDGLTKFHDEVTLLYYPWHGDWKVKVPRWTLEKMFECEPALKKIAKNLKPQTTLALLQGVAPEQAVDDVWELWFNIIGKEIVEVVCTTLGLRRDDEKDEFLEWFKTIAPEDTLEVFSMIIRNQITNPRIRGILKNLYALLEETAPQLHPLSENS